MIICCDDIVGYFTKSAQLENLLIALNDTKERFWAKRRESSTM